MQTAATSKAMQSSMPSAVCTRVALAGKVWSGVAVASTIRPICSGADAGRVERLARGLGRQRGGGLAVAGDMAGVDAGPLDDPFVGGVDASRRARALVTRRGGSAEPVPAMIARRRHLAAAQLRGLRRDVGEILGDLAGQVLAHHPRRHPDRIGDALVGGAAMALHDEAVEAEEDRAIMVVRIEMVAEQFGRRAARSGSRSWSGPSW